MTPIAIVAYLLLFIGVGFLFVLACLLLGWVLRPRAPRPSKLETYECGEPTVGPGFVQFDLRFYVVALVFLIFEVEVGFFFPWATVFGKAVQLRNPRLEKESARLIEQLGVQNREAPNAADGKPARSADPELIHRTADQLARMAMADVAVFFGVLLVGFAYVWKRGDLMWVRAVATPSGDRIEGPGRAAIGAGRE